MSDTIAPAVATIEETARKVQIAERTALAFREIAELTTRHADELKSLGIPQETATRLERIAYAATVGESLAVQIVEASRCNR